MLQTFNCPNRLHLYRWAKSAGKRWGAAMAWQRGRFGRIATTSLLAAGLLGVGLHLAGIDAIAQQKDNARTKGPARSGPSVGADGWSAKVITSSADRTREPNVARSKLIPFKSAPFPYEGTVPPDDKPFYDYTMDGQRGHTARSGAIYWERETFSEGRVLVHVPKDLNLARPALLVLYLHGHGATLERDVARRQALPRQVDASGLNAVLVAPQFAVDAPDSSSGKFWRRGALKAFLDETEQLLNRTYGTPKKPPAAFRRMPVVIIAYSGGYVPAAWLLHHGGADDRILGVVVLDGVYGEHDKYTAWIKRRRQAFFMTAYGPSTQAGVEELRQQLGRDAPEPVTTLEQPLSRGAIVLIATPAEVSHRDYLIEAWASDPVAKLLAAVPGYTRRARR